MSTRRLDLGFVWGAAIVSLTIAAVLTGTALRSGEQRRNYVFDGPTYDSVESLVRESDLVVTGEVGDVIGHQWDAGELGIEDREEVGVPLVFHEVIIESSLSGAADRVVVASLDAELGLSNDTSQLRSGQKVVLFLNLETADTAPGITVVDSHYSIVGGDNGVFDIAKDRALARSPIVLALTDSEAEVIQNDPTRDPGDRERHRVWFAVRDIVVVSR